MKKIFLILMTFSSFIVANPLDPQNFVAPTQQELQQNQSQKIDDLKANSFYLNLDPKDINAIQKRDEEVRNAFDRFSQKEINYKPAIRPIASMDSINLHPYFTTTILLPKGSIISHIDSSNPMAVLKYENNAVLIRPNQDFKIANFTILYKLNDENRILNVLANFYEKNPKDFQDKLNLVYSYLNTPKLDDLEVLSAYVKEFGSLPKEQYSFIQIGDISYRIVKDEKYGNIMRGGNKYRIDNNTIYR
ncbi:hypothetical protein CFVI97532_07165 [Campylobacter fetus subsp. venerealis cfvi97/532]|nr:hypothetical protein CFVI97532_07165 [Campylobacter fetus subsp. venerealis cfvi97/532]